MTVCAEEFERLYIGDVEINYNLMPWEVSSSLSGDDLEGWFWSSDLIKKWNGGKSGVVTANIPLLMMPKQCSIGEARSRQIDSGIGFSLPVEIVSALVLPQNEPAKIIRELKDQKHKINNIVVLGRREQLVEFYGCSWIFLLNLCLNDLPTAFFREFHDPWGDNDVLAGTPELFV